MKKIFNKKVSLGFRIFMILTTMTLLVLLILSVPRTYGSYIFENGTSNWDPKDPDSIKAFADRVPILGNLLWGDESLIKVGIFFAGIAFVGSVFQMTRWFKGEYKNLFSSLLVIASTVLTFALSSNIAILVMGIIITIVGLFAVLESASVVFYKHTVI